MMQKAAEKALSLLGEGYIYGAKGQICSPAFRRTQAQQYPEHSETILGTGAKWDGKPVWDCAQLTRAAAKEAGVSLVSGATSQWRETPWARQGTIDSLPQDEPVFVFREKDGRMQHTGVALGDGTCVHAKGTAWGVVREGVAECGWTHWAAPEAPEEPALYTATVTAASGSTVNARQTPAGAVVRRVPVGTTVEVLQEMTGWRLIRYQGQTAYMVSSFLRKNDDLLRRIEQIEARLSAAGL